MVDMRLLQLRPLKNTLEPSANNVGYNASDTLAISLIYIKKKERTQDWTLGNTTSDFFLDDSTSL